jgi:hypothetical protein
MSDAPARLVKARPDAMGGYCRYLNLAGSHLDPKTCYPISVITWAHARAASGLEQRLTRVLREGSTAIGETPAYDDPRRFTALRARHGPSSIAI